MYSPLLRENTTKMTHLLSITQQPDGTHIVSGNTFPIRDILKRCGGMWDAGRKAWIMPPEFDPSALPQPSLVNARNADDDDQTVSQSTRRTPPEDLETMLIPSTNTYGVKDQIVKAGGRWVPETKEWRVPIDFDMSIVPKVESRQSRAAVASATGGTTGEVVAQRPRVIHCGLCGAEGHARNRCTCSHCGTVGFHRPDRCPTIHPRWKFLVQNPDFGCTCNATHLCDSCEHVCCRDAVPVPCVCLLKTLCATHGERCHGTHD